MCQQKCAQPTLDIFRWLSWLGAAQGSSGAKKSALVPELGRGRAEPGRGITRLGDMLGSAKLNGMAGHSAIFGDCFSHTQGTKASRSRGARALYYPMSPPQNNEYNPSRPASYDLSNLPLHTEQDYWQTINDLSLASKVQRVKITKQTGISRLPLCAASPAFIHLTFFPVDPFHIFYENCMAFIWDTWTANSKLMDRIHLAEDKARRFGEAVAAAIKLSHRLFVGQSGICSSRGTVNTRFTNGWHSYIGTHCLSEWSLGLMQPFWRIFRILSQQLNL